MSQPWAKISIQDSGLSGLTPLSESLFVAARLLVWMLTRSDTLSSPVLIVATILEQQSQKGVLSFQLVLRSISSILKDSTIIFPAWLWDCLSFCLPCLPSYHVDIASIGLSVQRRLFGDGLCASTIGSVDVVVASNDFASAAACASSKYRHDSRVTHDDIVDAATRDRQLHES